MKYSFIVPFLFLLLLLNACEDSGVGVNPVETQRGRIVNIISENEVSLADIQNLAGGFTSEAESIPELKFGIKLISVVYNTVDYNGSITEASGVISIPDKGDPSPLFSFHHGTQTKRENVGSQNIIYSPDAVIAGALGYIAVSPDLLGLGVSTLIHPYHHEETSASASIDLLRAARNYCMENGINLKNSVFLAGYSEGGYVTAAVQKEIEANLNNEFNVVASAPMAGAHDLLETANQIVVNEFYERPSFLAFMIVSYNEIYNWDNLDYYFNSEYEHLIANLFDGSLTTGEIDAVLPEKLSLLFEETFLTEFRNGTAKQLIEALKENSLLDFAPVAPVLIIHGNSDTYVPYQNALTAKESWIRMH